MVFTVLIVLLSVIFYDAVVSETLLSVRRCLEIIIPSLYGSMFIACLVTNTGLHSLAGKIFSLPSRRIFHIPSEIFSIFLISNVSGYPAGAKLLKNLLDEGKISEEEFSRYCCFCFSSGPAFISGVSGNGKTGLIIFISNLTANLIAAFISGIKTKRQPACISKEKCSFSCSTLLDSADSTARGMLQLCSVIIAFSVIKAVFSASGIVRTLSELISSLTTLSLPDSTAAVMSVMEITSISDFSGYSRGTVSLMAAIFSSGGICVIMQIFCIAGKNLNRKRFTLFRLLSASLSYCICFVLYTFFCSDIAASASTFEIHSPDQPLMPSLLLIVMSIMLISMDKEKKTNKKLRWRYDHRSFH